MRFQIQQTTHHDSMGQDDKNEDKNSSCIKGRAGR